MYYLTHGSHIVLIFPANQIELEEIQADEPKKKNSENSDDSDDSDDDDKDKEKGLSNKKKKVRFLLLSTV